MGFDKFLRQLQQRNLGRDVSFSAFYRQRGHAVACGDVPHGELLKVGKRQSRKTAEQKRIQHQSLGGFLGVQRHQSPQLLAIEEVSVCCFVVQVVIQKWICRDAALPHSQTDYTLKGSHVNPYGIDAAPHIVGKPTMKRGYKLFIYFIYRYILHFSLLVYKSRQVLKHILILLKRALAARNAHHEAEIVVMPSKKGQKPRVCYLNRIKAEF